MVEKIKKFFRRIGYMFAFGMKGADDIILSQDKENANIGIIQTKETHNLGEALMRGEVTQEVEELRYRNYKIAREANNYKYIGGGQAIKKTKKVKNLKNFKFRQANYPICEDILHELQRIGSYEKQRFCFDIIYKDIQKFRLEEYITYGDFKIDDTIINVDFVFDKNLVNSTDIVSKMMLKELKKLCGYVDEHTKEKNEICSNISTLTFTTNKSDNEDEFVNYIISDLHFVKCTEMDDSFILSYVSTSFDRIDLSAKYFSKTQEEKYINKESKTQTINFGEVVRTEICSECGNTMDVYDADITRYNFGKCICQNCLMKKNTDILLKN